jgi:hypothetical protein
MRDGDRGETSALAHGVRADIVDQGNAVPEHVAVRGLDQQRALAGTHRGLHPDPEKVRILLAHDAAVRGSERLERREGMPPGRHVAQSTIVLTERADGRIPPAGEV